MVGAGCNKIEVVSLPTNLNKKDVVIIALLGAFCLYLFREIILGGHYLIGDDFIGFYLGMKKFLYDELWAHHTIPFWNPYLFGGMPFWAHFESTIFYPLGLLFWFITPAKAYGYTMFIHLILAGVFMYALARSFGMGRAGSFVAAAVFTCNGFVTALLYLGHMCPIQSYIWLPLVIYLLNRAITSKTPYFHVSMAGAIWGVQILAGAPQDAFYTFLASMFFLACSINTKDNIRSFGNIPKLCIIAIVLFIVGAGLASIQIVPAFELIRESVRASLDNYEMVTMASYPPEGIITTVMPHFFGNYAKDGFWVSNIPWSVPQQNLYVGILPLILLLFISNRHSGNKRIIVFAGCLALIALVLALGRHTPVYKLAYLLPGFDRFRAPSKIIVLWVFALGLLAGKGMDGLLHYRKNTLHRRAAFCIFLVISLAVLDILFFFDRSIVLRFFSSFIPDEAIPGRMAYATQIIQNDLHRLTLFCAFILFIIFLYIRDILKPGIGAICLCALFLLDLGYVASGHIRHDDSIYREIEKIKHNLDVSMVKDKNVYRVGSYKFYLGQNLEMYLGYQTVGGFTALFPSRFYEYFNRYSEYKLPEGAVDLYYGKNKNNIFMDLLNVKYEIFHTARSYALRKTYLPRAFIVPECKIVKKEDVLNYLIRPDFVPTQTVLFEKDDFRADLPSQFPPKQGNTGRAKVISYRPDHIVLVTDSSEPGYLFLSEIFYPGWKAFVDGEPKRILRGNYLFRVIELPAGHHVIRMVFDPLSIKIGTGVTVFILFMLLNVIVYHFGKRIIFLKRG